MKILIFNWRDIKNPLSGGAEILTFEMCKRWVKEGHEVTWFSSEFNGGDKSELIGGIKVIRDGKPDLRTLWRSVHFKAFKFYRSLPQERFDVIVDEIHGLPFFTPLYVRQPVVLIICEVAKNIWDKMFPFPWNLIGKSLERLSILLYKNKRILAISLSTKNDLIEYGLKPGNVTVLPMGFNTRIVKTIRKETYLTLIFVARINRMKGIEDALKTVSIIRESYTDVNLWILGRGDEEYIVYLRDMIIDLDLKKNVKFWGFVTEAKKFELLSKAHFIIAPSIREGFGLIIPEAGSVETPAVIYNVPGLKDIVNKKNGVIIKNKSPDGMANQILKVFNNKKLYNSLRKSALTESKKYNWDKTSKTAIRILKKV